MTEASFKIPGGPGWVILEPNDPSIESVIRPFCNCTRINLDQHVKCRDLFFHNLFQQSGIFYFILGRVTQLFSFVHFVTFYTYILIRQWI